MKKIFILFLTLFVSFFFIEKNTPVKAEGVPILDKLGEISKIQVVDSVGRFEKTSNKKYKYTYVKLSYNEEFGYYYHPNATTESIDISLSEMPKVAFDSNENLINGYYSINNNYWYKCEVKDVSDEIDIHAFVESHIVYNDELAKFFIPLEHHEWKYFNVYFNFQLNGKPIDCLYELRYNLPLYYRPLGPNNKMFSYYVSNFKCNLKFDQKVISSDFPNSWMDALIWNVGSSEKTAIEKGNYSLTIEGRNYEYEYKTIFIDNDYSAFDANPNGLNRDKYVCLLNWSDNPNHPTYFNYYYFFIDSPSDMRASAVFSYKGVLYSFENVVVNVDNAYPANSGGFNFDLLLKILKYIFILFIGLILLIIVFNIVNLILKKKNNSSN